MNRSRFSAVVAIALMVPATCVLAHHGTAGSYDEAKVVEIKGIVKEFRWRNPHSALFVVGKDAAGKEVTYALEMGSPNTLVRIGYTRDTFKAGDQLEIQMHPSLTNPANGYSPTSMRVSVNGKPLKTAREERQ